MKNYYWDNPLFAKLKGVLWAEDNPHGRNEVTQESSKSHGCVNGVYIHVDSRACLCTRMQRGK
jgi:hypothetical protein